jgi:arylsulfatase A-like enzyme
VSLPPYGPDRVCTPSVSDHAHLVERLLESNWEELAFSRLGSVLPPDIFLIVLDSVSGPDLMSPERPGNVSHGFKGLETFASQAVTYPDAVTTSTDSASAHASLFTGHYPASHGVLRDRSGAHLTEPFQTLAGELGRDGYGTFSLSGSPVVCNRLGLTRGFKHACWGHWADRYLRQLGGGPPTGDTGVPGTQPAAEDGAFNLLETAGTSARALADRLPLLFDSLSRLAGSVLGGKHAGPRVAASWIEPTLESVLSRAPDDLPLFGFMSLMDARAPYFGLELPASSPVDYISAFSTPQNEPTGSGRPGEADTSRLRPLYENALGVLDRRLDALLQTIRRLGRWENSLIIVTSDRGSPFTPAVSPGISNFPPEPRARVPLFVKFPGEAMEGAVARGTASLVDILPTALSEIGLPVSAKLSGLPLRSLVTTRRPTPVFFAPGRGPPMRATRGLGLTPSPLIPAPAALAPPTALRHVNPGRVGTAGLRPPPAILSR